MQPLQSSAIVERLAVLQGAYRLAQERDRQLSLDVVRAVPDCEPSTSTALHPFCWSLSQHLAAQSWSQSGLHTLSTGSSAV